MLHGYDDALESEVLVDLGQVVHVWSGHDTEGKRDHLHVLGPGRGGDVLDKSATRVTVFKRRDRLTLGLIRTSYRIARCNQGTRK